jgi:hypothetical protein
MPDWGLLLYSRFLLIAGAAFFFAAVLWTCIGKTMSHSSGWVYRAKEPNEFRKTVAMYYLCGVLFIAIGYFLHLGN